MRLTAISTQSVADLSSETDLLISACGYESRCTHIAEVIGRSATHRVALGFTQQHELNYQRNREWFKGHNFVVSDVADEEVEELLGDILKKILDGTDVPRISVDISCLNRLRLARLVRAIHLMRAKSATVSFAYNVAEYTPPSEISPPTSVAEPVIPEFAGWSSTPDRPPAAILGLGYEQSKAIGIIDHLEINNAAWAFIPVSPIGEYLGSLETANRSLFQMIPFPGRVSQYDVLDPSALFRELNTLVLALKEIYNPIMIPLGPKIFALAALLIASVHSEIGVWRVSGGTLEPPVDRRPSPHSTVLRAVFESGPAE